MKSKIEEIILKNEFNKENIVFMLSLEDEESMSLLHKKAYETKSAFVGKTVYYRGLVEFSNVCEKNCFYCGIRASSKTTRYAMDEEEIFQTAMLAHKYNYGSVVLQSGERSDESFINMLCRVLNRLKKESEGRLGITLCVGEQTEETYKRFISSGAHRYLLRIETSSKELYSKIHPQNDKHSFEKRMEALMSIKKAGFQTGSGVMIGLPFQTIEDLACDLLFMREIDLDMVGMGPYIEHTETPLFAEKDKLLSRERRRDLTLNMIAVLRLMMKDINIAATTALQALDERGREKGLLAGANVVMPNITPRKYRDSYFLYEDKPCVGDEAEECKRCLEGRVKSIGEEIGYGKWGDSKHFFNRVGQ